MASKFQSGLPHFGLRDFFFYLLPGAVALGSLELVFKLKTAVAPGLGSIEASAIAVIFAYYLGHVIYPLAYIPRLALRLINVLRMPKDEKNEEKPRWYDGLVSKYRKNRELEVAFAKDHMLVVEQHPAFYNTVAFRDRSLARFSSGMIFPTLLVAYALDGKISASSEEVWAAAIIAAAGFWCRFLHYNRRYKTEVSRCSVYPRPKDSADD